MEENGFQLPENRFPLSGMNDFVKKYVPTGRKKSLAGVSENWRKKWFPLVGT